MKKTLAVLAAVAALIACGGGSPSGPTPSLIDAPNPGVVTSASTEDPAPSATGGTAFGAKVWAHGKVDVTGPWDGLVCYFWYGPHEQDKAHPDIPVSAKAGETVSIDWPGIRADNDPNHCKVQIDVGTSCAKSSIIPGMLAAGYVDIKPCKTECVEDPVETISCTECPVGAVKPEDCYKTCTKTVDYKCKPDVVTTFNEACVCTTSCVEEGPYVGDPVWMSEALPGPCPAQFDTSCHLLGEVTTTWDCQDPTTEPLCRPAPCPPPEGMCFYEIAGGAERSEGDMCLSAGGVWDRWGPADKVQCRIPLPGILDHDFRLTPGQSHPDCLKYTGPR